MLKTIGSSVVFTIVVVLTFGAQAQSQAAVDCSSAVAAVATSTADAVKAIEDGDDCAALILAELAVIDPGLAASTLADIAISDPVLAADAVIEMIGTNPGVVEAAVSQLGASASNMLVEVAKTADASTIISVLDAVESAGLNDADLTSIDVAFDDAITSRVDLSEDDISSITAVIEETPVFEAPASSSPS